MQSDLFARPTEPVSETVDPDDVRVRLHALLDEAKSASVMPWPERRAKVNAIIFPQMANWLPEEEANVLRAAFASEMERLRC